MSYTLLEDAGVGIYEDLSTRSTTQSTSRCVLYSRTHKLVLLAFVQRRFAGARSSLFGLFVGSFCRYNRAVREPRF